MNRQGARIIRYIQEFGSITPIEAFRDLGITKLATRVSEMKAEGIQFEQARLSGKNRYGESVSYMQYKLKSVPAKQTETL